MTDVLVMVAIISNLAIAFAYLGIGLYVTPKFNLAGTSHGSRLAKLAGLTFFVTCAITHLELASHATGEIISAIETQAGWLISWHGIITHAVQAIAGLSFLALAMRHLQIRIYNKQYYERVLDDRIRQIERQLNDVAPNAAP
jgi:hypothetical protein